MIYIYLKSKKYKILLNEMQKIAKFKIEVFTSSQSQINLSNTVRNDP